MRTRFKNLGDGVYFGFIPEHGRYVASGSQIVIDGDLLSMLAGPRGKRYGPASTARLLRELVEAGVVEIEDVHEIPGNCAYRKIIGDGISTVFDLSTGFRTAHSLVLVYDRIRESMVPYVYVQKGIPDELSIRIITSPAPLFYELEVFVFC